MPESRYNDREIGATVRALCVLKMGRIGHSEGRKQCRGNKGKIWKWREG